MEGRTVSEIFNETPNSWGLRGDPYFWAELERHFKAFSLPFSAGAFTEEVHRCFEQATGEKLTRECEAEVKAYSHGGLSSGHLSGAFWLEQGIPLLLERLEKANAELERSRCVFTYDKQAQPAGIALIVTGSLVLSVIATLAAINRTPPYLLVFALYLLLYAPILIAGIQQVRLHSGSIEIHDGCIAYKRGQQTLLVPLRQVEKVSFSNLFFQTVKLHTPQGPIRIGKKIQDYQKLYMILAENIPKLKAVPEGPVMIRTGIFSTFVTVIIVVLMFCALVYMSVNGYREGSVPLFMALFLGVIGAFFAVFIVVSALSKPYQYRLDPEGVTECSLTRSKFHPRNTIQAIQYGQIKALYHTRFKHYRMVNYIQFSFADAPPLLIDDRFFIYPIEQAVRYAERVFGITPAYKDIAKL